jgi:hypothetical protein
MDETPAKPAELPTTTTEAPDADAIAGLAKPEPSAINSAPASEPELSRDQKRSLILSFLNLLIASPPCEPGPDQGNATETQVKKEVRN